MDSRPLDVHGEGSKRMAKPRVPPEPYILRGGFLVPCNRAGLDNATRASGFWWPLGVVAAVSPVQLVACHRASSLLSRMVVSRWSSLDKTQADKHKLMKHAQKLLVSLSSKQRYPQTNCAPRCFMA